MNDLHDLAAGYALDSLDEFDRARFERHLDECQTCQEAVRAFAETAADLARSVAAPADPELRNRILADVARTAQVGAAGSRWRGGAVAAVVALVVAIGGGWWVTGSDDRLANSVLGDPASVSVMAQPTPEGAGFVGPARVVLDPDTRRAVLVADGLRPLDAGETYELWVIGPDGPLPAGLFRPAGDGSATVLVEADVPPGALLALTVEPDGGSDQPTGDVLLVAEV